MPRKNTRLIFRRKAQLHTEVTVQYRCCCCVVDSCCCERLEVVDETDMHAAGDFALEALAVGSVGESSTNDIGIDFSNATPVSTCSPFVCALAALLVDGLELPVLELPLLELPVLELPLLELPLLAGGGVDDD